MCAVTLENSLAEYLRAIGGATLVGHGRTRQQPKAQGKIVPTAAAETVVLQRNSAPLSVPPLSLEGMREDLPPFRDYLWPGAPEATDARTQAVHAGAEELHQWAEGLPYGGYRRRKRLQWA
jgi:hypothetical protein